MGKAVSLAAVDAVKKNMNDGKSRSLHEHSTNGDSCENKRRECVDPWISFQRKEERHQISVLT